MTDKPDFETMAAEAGVSAEFLRRIDAAGYKRGVEDSARVAGHPARDAVRALLATDAKEGP